MKEIIEKIEKEKILKLPKENMSRIFSICEKDGEFSYLLNKSILFKNVENIPTNLIKKYKVQENDTLWKISYILYFTHELWWFIAKLNGIYDSTIDLIPGEEIIYLPEQTLLEILNSMN